MYVKQVIIQGFKSYKDQTVIEPFSPQHNVIVGRNGSGKSNFFAAIRFVLGDGDEYQSFNREERQALLHEGSGRAVVTAYVEIIFDNADDRFHTGKSELILRRTIGLKKDEYSLDRKNVPRAEVIKIFETAGFSRANPYYIVPQGRVTKLTNMQDRERLDILKDVAGTQVYEARREESKRILVDTDSKRKQIDDLLSYIRERLDELEEEKEELKKYQEQDKERRSLEYTFYRREQERISQRLETLESTRQGRLGQEEDKIDSFREREHEKDRISGQLRAIQQRLDQLATERRQLDIERKEAFRNKTAVDLQVKTLLELQHSAEETQAERSAQLSEVQRHMAALQTNLAQLLPEYNSIKEQEATLKEQLAANESAQRRLREKQGRQFRNKRERDDYLQKQIEGISLNQAQRKAIALELRENKEILEKEIAYLKNAIADIRSRLDNRQNVQELSDEFQRTQEEYERLNDEKKLLRREENQLEASQRAAREELRDAEQGLAQVMDRNTSRGLASVREIAARNGLQGVYGTVAELFEVPKQYEIAAENAAGGSLFHYVVDSQATSTKLIEILTKERRGRVTFIPLDGVDPKDANVPRASDVTHLLKKLKFDSKYEKAMQQVFGKTIVCPNLQIASQYARSHGLDAMTPEGYRADKKGSLTGGYYGDRRSRLDAIKKERIARQNLESMTQRLQEIGDRIREMEQQITRAYSDLEKNRRRKEQATESYVPLRQELSRHSQALQDKEDQLEKLAETQQSHDADQRNLERSLGELEAELTRPFQAALTKDEERRLEQLSTSVRDLRKQVGELNERRSALETRKTNIEAELRQNLRPREQELLSQETESAGGATTSSIDLQEAQHDMKRKSKVYDAARKRLASVETEIEQQTNQLSALTKSRDDIQRVLEQLAREIENDKKRLENSSAEKQRLKIELEHTVRAVNDIGVVPQDAFEKYKRWDNEKINTRLQKVKSSLKKYSNVNKKAFEQYANFTKQRDNLRDRREELDDSRKSIEELISHLDLRKNEAIDRTFRQVSREFAYVFEKLVPAGRGKLVIQRKSDKERRQELESDDEERNTVESYRGVGISVSFNSKHDEQQRIQQLSGGQKSLCALALVFAIQRCDPAPFYLFDEIDANLDAQYRTAVANMLTMLSRPGDDGAVGAQFICTTFRPEMVHVAEKCYGVSYSNKTSSIDVVDKEHALDFVEGQKQ